MFSNDLLAKAENVVEAYRRRGWMLATVESCTGGLIAGCLTQVAGSSDVVERGFVTYSNRAKLDLVAVKESTLARAGAVSGEVAEEMVAGAVARAPIDVAVSVTGVAGPGGGTKEKPVGLVYFGVATRDGAPRHIRHMLDGDREAVRLGSVALAFDLLLDAVR